MRAVLALAVLCLTSCSVANVAPGPGALQRGSLDADMVLAGPGDYGDQKVTQGNATIFAAHPDARFSSLDVQRSDATFTGFKIDARRAKKVALHLSGDRLTFTNGSAGNVVDEKGALVSGEDITISRSRFHDVTITSSQVHSECAFFVQTERLVLERNSFENCATMDAYLTWGFYWSPPAAPYGNWRIEGNHFGYSRMLAGQGRHYYALVACCGEITKGSIVRGNSFEGQPIEMPNWQGAIRCGNTGGAGPAWEQPC